MYFFADTFSRTKLAATLWLAPKISRILLGWPNANTPYYFLIATAVVIWSTGEVSIKMAQVTLPPLNVATGRFMLGTIFSLLAVLISGRFSLMITALKESGVKLAALGFIGITLSFGILVHASLEHTTAFSASALISLTPLFVWGIVAARYRERQTWYRKAGIVIGAAGALLLVVSEGLGSNFTTSNSFRGNLMVVVAAALFALYTVMIKPYTQKYGAIVVNSISIAFGTLFLIPAAFIYEGVHLQHATRSDWVIMGWLGLFVVAVAWLFYTAGLARVKSPTAGASLYFGKPIIALILSSVLLHEQIRPWEYVAIATISISFLITLFGSVRRQRQEARHAKLLS